MTGNIKCLLTLLSSWLDCGKQMIWKISNAGSWASCIITGKLTTPSPNWLLQPFLIPTSHFICSILRSTMTNVFIFPLKFLKTTLVVLPFLNKIPLQNIILNICTFRSTHPTSMHYFPSQPQTICHWSLITQLWSLFQYLLPQHFQ